MVSVKVLIADDEAHILHVVSMKLKNAGYEVVTAVDGEEGLELCLSEHPDVIITDYQMPIMTGLEMCKQLQHAPDGSHTPAIMLTARGFDLEPADMAEAGIVCVLTKPFSPREVLAKIEDVLTRQGGGSAAELK